MTVFLSDLEGLKSFCSKHYYISNNDKEISITEDQLIDEQADLTINEKSQE